MKKRCSIVLALGVLALSVNAYADGPAQVRPGDVVKLDIGPDTPRHVLYSDQTLESGSVAAGAYKVVVYDNFYDSGYGVVMSYNVQAGGPVGGTYSADNLGLGNGFVGGDEISEIWITVFRSSGDLSVGNEATVHLELWDGDPEGFVDTAANGFSGTKIAGSDADWSIGTMSGQFELRHVYATPVVIPNQRMWAVTQSTSCRMFYDLTYRKPTVGDDAPGDFWIDRMDDDGATNGSGVCCHDDTISCLEPDVSCGQANADACSDGDAEAPGWWSLGGPCDGVDATDSCSNFMHMVFTTTDTVISFLPVAADTKDTTSSGDWEIVDNEITMAAGARPVWLEFKVSDWDPAAAGHAHCETGDVCMKAWQIALDSSGYYSGQEGSLAPYEYACTSHSECPPVIGPGSMCVDDVCNNALIDSTRSDYLFNHPDIFEELKAIDVSTMDYRWGSTINVGDPIPSSGAATYAATLVVWVPADAKGTFSIYPKAYPESNLLDQDSQFMPLMGVAPALITVEVGQCCFGLGIEGKEGCIDYITAGQCPDAGLCHGECSDTHDPCLSDDDCPAGTCSGACSDDDSIACWADAECTEGTCSHDASACHADAECGETCADSGDACISWWDCAPGVCSSWDYYCVCDSDCPEAGAVCGSAKGSCGTTWGPDWVECTDDSECTAYDPPICDKPWDPEPCGTLTCDEERECVGGATCDPAAGDVCLPDKDLDCPAALDCVVQGASVFFPDQDCSYPCAECTVPGPNDPKCGDGDACTADVCNVNLICEHTAVTVTTDECCDPTCVKGDAVDLAGSGAVVSNIDYACNGSCGDNCADVSLAGDACVTDADCIGAGECNADNTCTDNLCSAPGTCAVGAQCGVPSNPPIAGSCSDGVPCLTVLDACDAGNCEGQDIMAQACTSNEYCESISEGVGSCDIAEGHCICVPPSLEFDVNPSQKPNGMCFEVGETILVDVYFANVGPMVTGAQFVVLYDTDCVSFNSISPADGSPFTYELAEIVDEDAGMIFYAVGVDPFIGGGANGTMDVATISFTKIGVCETCVLCFGGDNPMNTMLVDEYGWLVPGLETYCGDPIMENDHIALDVPDDIVTNVDCDAVTAMESWDPPTASGSCYPVDLVCTGQYPDGSPIATVIVMNGGEFPIGTSTFSCTATSTICGDAVTDGWTVTVSDMTSLDVTIQLSPIMAGNLERCIKFEMYSDTVQAPLVFEMVLPFGGQFDHIGHFTDSIKVPDAGQWLCITARDQLHTLRACDWLTCVDGVYEATFKGDPAYGGNWLIGGNLDGWKKENPDASHDVIDILDFGQFVANYGHYVDPDTMCDFVGAHADINGDGVVDALDFTFVSMNFLASSKECCEGSTAGVGNTIGLTEVTVDQLRQMGMGDLAVADLNRDGVLDLNDMNAFLAGETPVKKGVRGSKGSSLR